MFDNMKWFNRPAQAEVSAAELRVTSAPGSDFWRKTHYGFIRDNGHFYFKEVKGDFTAQVRVVGHYKDLYDQAGLMLRVDDENWIKTGIEFVDGRQNASVVVTREFSDWSVIGLDGELESFWLRVTRKAEAVEIFYSLDGEQYQLMRLAYLVPSAVTRVGPMCASPDGTGFDMLFTDFSIKVENGFS
jgi:regulation of enolase protein 1 (concanavalin A-like superfamily)